MLGRASGDFVIFVVLVHRPQKGWICRWSCRGLGGDGGVLCAFVGCHEHISGRVVWCERAVVAAQWLCTSTSCFGVCTTFNVQCALCPVSRHKNRAYND